MALLPRSFALQQLLAPSDEPVTRAEAKLHCRLDADLTADDLLVDQLIVAARQSIEMELARSLMPTTWVLGVPCFPAGKCLGLPRPPLRSVSKVEYVAPDDTLTLLPTTVYGVDTLGEPGTVYLKTGQAWPSTADVPNAVRVTYVAGWANEDEVPQPLKQALLWLVGHMYEYRELGVEKALTELPVGFDRLLWLYRFWEMG